MVTIHLTLEQTRLCWENARKASIGGTSRIRQSKDRKERLFEDQLVGQVGNCAGSVWWHGSDHDYRVTRDRANENPLQGDGGSDLTGLNVDFKTSLMRRSKNPLDYKLLVRPAERHSDWIYLLLLVPTIEVEKIKADSGLDVVLVGWLGDDELPEEPEGGGIFEGAYLVPAGKLHQIDGPRGQDVELTEKAWNCGRDGL